MASGALSGERRVREGGEVCERPSVEESPTPFPSSTCSPAHTPLLTLLSSLLSSHSSPHLEQTPDDGQPVAHLPPHDVALADGRAPRLLEQPGEGGERRLGGALWPEG
jgi:hypothetical protein